MRASLARLAGWTLIGGSLLGLVLSLAGLLLLAINLPRLYNTTRHMITTADEALTATGDGLVLASAALSDAEAAVFTLRTTIGDASSTITATLPAIDSLISLTGTDLPRTVGATREALVSASETARVADTVLASVSSIPIIGSTLYNPQVPLHVAIGEVATSLDGISPALADVQGGLRTARSNSTRIAGDLEILATNVGAIGKSISETQQVIARYQGVVNALQTQLDQLRGAPGWVLGGGLGFALFLLWLGLAQLSLLLQGRALLRLAERE